MAGKQVKIHVLIHAKSDMKLPGSENGNEEGSRRAWGSCNKVSKHWFGDHIDTHHHPNGDQ